MLVPIVFTFDTLAEGLSQAWLFYKAVSYSKRGNWPVIAQNIYFEEFEKQKVLFSNLFEQDVAHNFGYDIPNEQDIKCVYQISIPDEIENARVQKCGSRSDAYVRSFVDSWAEIENYICNQIAEFEAERHESVDGFVCLTHLRFVQNIADKLGKKVFYFEWAPFRYSVYRNTAYFDEGQSFLNYYDRYKKFNINNLPVFSRKEIMALFLNVEYLDYLDKNFKEDIYEVGIAGTYNNIVEERAFSNYDILEEFYRCKKIFSEKGIATRYHPGDPLKAQISATNEQSGVLLDFIFKCKRVMSINSNVEFEVMLCEKPVYDESGHTRYSGFVNEDIFTHEDRIASLEEINFLTFVVFVPYELVDCDEYIRFRLSDPTDEELYLYHLKYYLKCIGLDKSLFENRRNDWYKLILAAKQIDSEISEAESTNSETDLHSRIKYLENKINTITRTNEAEKQALVTSMQELESIIQSRNQEINSLKEEIEKINNTFSMKVTKPLRLLREKIKA